MNHKKVVGAITTAAVVSAVTLVVVLDDPHPAPAEQPHPALRSPSVSVLSSPTESISNPLPITPGPQPAPASSPSYPPAGSPRPESSAAPMARSTTPGVTPSPEPTEEARDDSPRSNAEGWIERRWIVTTEQGSCHDKPTTSKVAATVTAPGEIRSVTVRLQDHGQNIPFSMSRNGPSTWAGQIGPLSGEAHGRFDVVVEVTRANGEPFEKKVGELRVFHCCDMPPNREGSER